MAASRNNPSTDFCIRLQRVLSACLRPGERIAVGLSGGCDSVVLLHAVCAGRAELTNISAVHVHHGLSPNADDWALFCQRYCDSLRVPLAIRHVTVNPAGEGVEAAARAARYAAFADFSGDCLLLAQHRGDQAETVLFNLLRGCGVQGAAAMPVERLLGEKRLIRPMLSFSREEIETYARQNGLRWIEDESNQDLAFSRNFLRHDTLAGLSERFPSAEKSLAQAASHFAEASVLLDELAEMDWLSAGRGEMAVLSALRELSLYRLKNLLRYRLRYLGWRVPVSTRLEEFARQLQTAAPDRHPSLELPDGVMRASRGLLGWYARK